MPKARAQAGCDAFVTKPCLPDALVVEIKRLLESHAGRGSSSLARIEPQTLLNPRDPTQWQSHHAKRLTKASKKAHPTGATPGHAPASRKHEAARADGQARRRRASKLERVKVPSTRRRETRIRRQDTSTASSAPSSHSASVRSASAPSPPTSTPFTISDIAAVVSNTPIVVQDPTRENVLAHQRVNETVMQKHTVIPMSFGTVFKTDDDIMELLRSAYDAFSDVLNKMQDKFEFGLKVLWDREQIIREIEDEDEDIRRLKSEISSQKGSTYFARMQYGRLIDAALQSRSERYVAEIFDALRERLGGVAVEQADRRPHDHECRVPGLARDGAAVRLARQGDRPAVREADVQVHRPVAAVQLRQHPA